MHVITFGGLYDYDFEDNYQCNAFFYKAVKNFPKGKPPPNV